MGPIELLDYVGLDTSKFIMDGVCACRCMLHVLYICVLFSLWSVVCVFVKTL